MKFGLLIVVSTIAAVYRTGMRKSTHIGLLIVVNITSSVTLKVLPLIAATVGLVKYVFARLGTDLTCLLRARAH